jgi:phospholipid/cholesterol/gamma-HCH transport system substrate-binding protein
MPNRNVLVGIFVIAGLALFTTGIYMVGNRHQAFARHTDFYAEFSSLDGLSKGSQVRVAGMEAGEVIAIDVPDSPSSRFRVEMRIDDEFRGLVRTDSVVTIDTEGVVGDTFLTIHTGTTHAPSAEALATLPSKEAVDVSELLERGSGLLNDADDTVKQVGTKLNGALDGITTTIGNANDLVVGLKQGRGTAGMLLQDEVLAAQVRKALANVEHATANLDLASGRADAFISDVQSRDLPKKAAETIGIVKSAASNIDESAKQLHRTIVEATGQDEQGSDAGENIKATLSHLNVATANMADDTEALKHNFFLRGFFKHRGYYDLTDISPAQYRKDRVFSNPTNHRAWLSATELFRTDGDGVERLSSEGRHLLNSTLEQYGDSVFDRPVVIEGYSNAGDLAEQLSSSRDHAILVRQYLERHFQLDGTNLGAVSMNDSPPEGIGIGHSPWNGVCIVVVEAVKR